MKPHYSHGREIDPDAERELRAWARLHEVPPDPAEERMNDAMRRLPSVDDGSDHYDPGDELIREAMHPGRPLHSIEDYSSWRGSL